MGALLPLFAGCGVVFERSSEVIDMRVLAIQADPPEIIADGPPPATVKIRALTVDPRDPTRVVEQDWRACTPNLSTGAGAQGGGPPGGAGQIASGGAPAVDDTPDGRCSESDAQTEIAKATAPIGELSQEIPVKASFVEQIAALGATGTALSLYLTTQLRVQTPEGPLYSIKRVPNSPAVPAGRKANRNPHLIGIAFEGEPWEPGKPVKIKHDACTADKRQTVAYRTRLDAELQLCAFKVQPLYDPDANEEYEVKTFDGQIIKNRERMRFQWFADHGNYSSQRTDEPNVVGLERADPTGTYWREPPEIPPGGKATIWLVMRDGRGGVTWTSRELIWE